MNAPVVTLALRKKEGIFLPIRREYRHQNRLLAVAVVAEAVVGFAADLVAGLAAAQVVAAGMMTAVAVALAVIDQR